MAVIRVRHRKNFTVLPNELVNDRRLSFRTVGLAAFLLSKPSDWVIRPSAVSALLRGAGRDAVLKCLRELEKAGYARYITVKESGKIVSNEWVIYDSPLPENQVVT